MTQIKLDDLPGRTLAGRYRLDERLASGLLSAVFRATDTAGAEGDEALVVQLRRPWEAGETAPPAELHDHQILGGGFTADIFLESDLNAAAGSVEGGAAAWLVAQTDAIIQSAANPDTTAPELPPPLELVELEEAWLEAADHEALAFDAAASVEDQPDDEGDDSDIGDTAMEMPAVVIDPDREH